MRQIFIGLFLAFVLIVPAARGAEVVECDICVFGGTCGGIAATIQASRMGKRAVLVESSKYLGGMTTGGLGATDIGNKAAVGGISREFYARIAKHYAQSNSWTFESSEDYFSKRRGGQAAASSLSGADATMWTFEPHVAEEIYFQMLRDARIPYYIQQRLQEVKKDGARITEIVMENGRVFRAKMFIDATYEGDLMAKAKVSYHVGREANATYGETLNGIRPETPKHQFTVHVDPYVKPGDEKSGLLPFIQSGDGGIPGDGDKRVQTYNYRLCFTTDPENRLPVLPPPNYDPKKFELLGRYFAALVAADKKPQLGQFWNPIWMPNLKTDINNNGGFSTDFIGMNYDYPEASYDRRDQIRKEHENYMRGFITFVANDPRVPEAVRAEMQKFGPAKDEFLDTGGWPRELYVREGRRLIGEIVMTEKHCRGVEVIKDSVGLAAYNMDSHNCQRIVRNGHVENEGDVQVPPMKPYSISYRAIVPKAAECANLFVPVCLSSSHIAYGSIRMEPVFMILGQSSATAAALAIDDNVTVQKLNYDKLRARLIADKQILEWKGGGGAAGNRAYVDPKSLKGIVMDDTEAKKVGAWSESSSVSWHVGRGYAHDGNANKGKMSLTYSPEIPEAGEYEIIAISTPNANRASNVPVIISISGKEVKKISVNQKLSTNNGFASLGKFQLPAGHNTTVTISNEDTDGYVVADGVQFLRVK